MKTENNLNLLSSTAAWLFLDCGDSWSPGQTQFGMGQWGCPWPLLQNDPASPFSESRWLGIPLDEDRLCSQVTESQISKRAEGSKRAFSLNPAFVVTFRKWILDILAAVGTTDALRLIKDKFLKGEVETDQMAQAMVTSVHMVTATKETFEIFKVRVPQRESIGDQRRRIDLASLFCSRSWQTTSTLKRAEFCIRSLCWATVPWLPSTVRIKLAALRSTSRFRHLTLPANAINAAKWSIHFSFSSTVYPRTSESSYLPSFRSWKRHRGNHPVTEGYWQRRPCSQP